MGFSVLREGLKLDFLSKPPFTGVRHVNILLQEVDKLLKKGAIEPVLQTRYNQVFIQHFPCSKGNGGFKTSYKLKTIEQVSQETTLQDGLSKQGYQSSSTTISIDLKDAYFLFYSILSHNLGRSSGQHR